MNCANETLEEFERQFRELAKDCIFELRGTDFDGNPGSIDDKIISKTLKIIDKIKDDEIARYQIEKPRRQQWPFNDPKLKPTKAFKEIYPTLWRYIIRWNDVEGNMSIKAAGGSPFSEEKLEDGKHGDAVIQVDIDKMMINTGCSRSKIYGVIKSLAEAGVLVKLHTSGPQKPLYVIGNWVRGLRTFRCNYRLQRTALRKSLKTGLIEQGLFKS